MRTRRRRHNRWVKAYLADTYSNLVCDRTRKVIIL